MHSSGVIVSVTLRYADLSKVDEIFENVESVNQRLKDYAALEKAGGVAPARWKFDASDWWLEVRLPLPTPATGLNQSPRPQHLERCPSVSFLQVAQRMDAQQSRHMASTESVVATGAEARATPDPAPAAS